MSEYETKENPTTKAGLPTDRTIGLDPSVGGINLTEVGFALELFRKGNRQSAVLLSLAEAAEKLLSDHLKEAEK